MEVFDARIRKNLAEVRREISPYIIRWWNYRANRLGFPQIPSDWIPWPEVHNKPEEGIHDQECFFNAKFVNREHGYPLVLGVHFNHSTISAMIREEDPSSIPLSHAVNLNEQGKIVDITWGQSHMAGLMVGRGFGIAPIGNLKTYCVERGFSK